MGFLTWPINIPALMLAIDLSFLLGSFKLNQNDELSLNKKLTSHLLKGKLPQLWEGSTWLTLGYGHNGPPLQYSCLENPIDRGAWWAVFHGVTKSRIQLSDFTSLYGHLSLKAALCWEWLNHTKNDQLGNYEIMLGAL